MTALTSKREQILEYIRNTILPRINGEGNYNLSPVTISREFRYPDELHYADYPALFILDDYSTTYNPLTSKQYTTGSVQQDMSDGMVIGVLGYVTQKKIGGNDPAGSISTEINKMFADILTAFFTNKELTFGGLIQGMTLLDDNRVIQYKDKSRIGVVLVRFSIKYDFNPYKNIV